MKLKRAHRVGLPGHSAPRTIVARFEHFSDWETITNQISLTSLVGTSDRVGNTRIRASVPGDVATTGGVNDPTQAIVPDTVTMVPVVGSDLPLDGGRAGPSTGVAVSFNGSSASVGNS
ncbi:hypothetical protein E2C01_072492 [Portunus trituberculatus]|uniref:Uncharacterized protein n=1 Tax=Portunus trituberculatus TaxID=210409 RepID=A0A5B7I7Z3_PORTR|nr:hypothetical protein [Portunus trituberculatus]